MRSEFTNPLMSNASAHRERPERGFSGLLHIQRGRDAVVRIDLPTAAHDHLYHNLGFLRVPLSPSTVFRKFISGILLAMFSVERYVCSCPTMRSG